MNPTSNQPLPALTASLVNALLGIKPLAKLLKWQARNMMIKQAEKIGVSWRETVNQLRERNWQEELNQVKNSQLTYPEHYLRSFHGYDRGHLSWQAAWECEVAACTVHSRLWQDVGREGDRQLRQNYHDLLGAYLTCPPQDILDLHCTAGMSSFALQALYPQAQVTGLDFSPYYLAVAKYNSQVNKLAVLPSQWAKSPANQLAEAERNLIPPALMTHYLRSQNPLQKKTDWVKPDYEQWDIPLDEYLKTQGASAEALRLMNIYPASIDFLQKSGKSL